MSTRHATRPPGVPDLRPRPGPLLIPVLVLVLGPGFGALPPPIGAFEPPVAREGPLTVRIDGPATVSKRGVASPLSLRIESSAGSPIRCAARVEVIDGWRIRGDATREVTVEGRGSVTLEYELVATERALAAHYPVHARVAFEHEGRKHEVHPILILEGRFPDPPPRESPPGPRWSPVEVPSNGGLALWRVGAHRTVLRVFGEEAPRVQPVGWLGSEPATRASVTVTSIARGAWRDAIGVHPPWFEGRAGSATVEFPLRLPRTTPLRLRLATAIRDHRADQGEPPSDGVTLRVRATPWEAPAGAEGALLFERHSAAKAWEEAEVDLGSLAGRTIRLQLEIHPGPTRNTVCDQAYIAEPTIVAGTPPDDADPLPAPGSPSRRLGVVTNGGVEYEVRVWPGGRGLLDTVVGFAAGNRKLFLRGLSVRVLGDALEEWASPTRLVSTRTEDGAGRHRVLHTFEGPRGGFDLVGELAIESGALRVRLRLENEPPPRPWEVARIEDAAIRRWGGGGPAKRVYAGAGNVIVEPGAFRLPFDGHRLSTSFVGYDFATGISVVEAVDVPPDRLEVDPEERRYTLHAPHAQTRTIIPAPDVWTAVATWREASGRRAAGGVARLSGRFVFDLWGGRYGPSAELLERSFRYGLTDAVVVWHNWQRWGYDYRLPDIYPPNPDLGTFAEFERLVETCRRHAVLFAPHDNYIDVYPDADGFTYDDVAFTAGGDPVKAWLNRGREAQSYRWRPDRVRAPLERNVRRIREGFAPTAYFIDVWSSIGPYDYWTRRGAFHDRLESRRIWGECFAWIRETLGEDAPQISESGHDQLVGFLDGAQTNHLRVGRPADGYYRWAVLDIPCRDAERVPWIDAAYHDRFILHGAGYEPRYAAGLDRRTHGIYSDDYIATEVLTGHPAMVKGAFGPDVVRKYWLLHGVMRDLALRRLESVRFADGDIHRQEVRWAGGARVLVNRGDEPWKTGKHLLPPYGFFARVPEAPLQRRAWGDTVAGLVRIAGQDVEFSLSEDGLYVNTRSPPEPVRVLVVRTDGAARMSRRGDTVEILPLPGSDAFTLAMEWDDFFEVLLGEIPDAPPTRAEAFDDDGTSRGMRDLRSDGRWVTLGVEKGVFAYRLRW